MYALDDLRIQDGRTAAALGCIVADQLAIRDVSVLADQLREPAIHQRRIALTQFLAPRTILGLPPEDFLQAEGGEIFAPN